MMISSNIGKNVSQATPCLFVDDTARHRDYFGVSAYGAYSWNVEAQSLRQVVGFNRLGCFFHHGELSDLLAFLLHENLFIPISERRTVDDSPLRIRFVLNEIFLSLAQQTVDFPDKQGSIYQSRKIFGQNGRYDRSRSTKKGRDAPQKPIKHPARVCVKHGSSQPRFRLIS